MIRRISYLFCVLILIMLVSPVFAQGVATSKNTVTLTGYLYDSEGAVALGQFEIKFVVYDDAGAGANVLFEEMHTVEPNSDGSYAVIIGKGVDPTSLVATDGIPANALTGDYWFLGITIGTDDEISPRMKLSAVPYATDSAMFRGIPATDFARYDSVGSFDGEQNFAGNVEAFEKVIANDEMHSNGDILFANNVNIAGDVNMSGVFNFNDDIYFKGSLFADYFVNVDGDTMTGRLNLPTDGLQVGSNQLIVNSTGIGFSTTPTERLDIRDSSGVGAMRIGRSNNNVDGTLRYYGDSFQGYSAGWRTFRSYWDQNGTSIYYNNGRVGMGTSSPGGDLNVWSYGPG
ncbi:MAG: hypothetical protein K8S87_04275, partial [Planctomycetes bacterium]|nr:hypothetical protein [Planctomycetota bacterium]